jgi:hypothetical protein
VQRKLAADAAKLTNGRDALRVGARVRVDTEDGMASGRIAHIVDAKHVRVHFDDDELTDAEVWSDEELEMVAAETAGAQHASAIADGQRRSTSPMAALSTPMAPRTAAAPHSSAAPPATPPQPAVQAAITVSSRAMVGVMGSARVAIGTRVVVDTEDGECRGVVRAMVGTHYRIRFDDDECTDAESWSDDDVKLEPEHEEGAGQAALRHESPNLGERSLSALIDDVFGSSPGSPSNVLGRMPSESEIERAMQQARTHARTLTRSHARTHARTHVCSHARTHARRRRLTYL